MLIVTLMRDIKCGKLPFRLSKRIIFNENFLETLDYQDFEAKIKINGFSIDFSSRGIRLSINFFLEEIEPLVIEEDEIEYR